MNTPTLKTERLTLRKFTEQDMEALFFIDLIAGNLLISPRKCL